MKRKRRPSPASWPRAFPPSPFIPGKLRLVEPGESAATSDLARNLRTVRERISRAAGRSARDPADVTLVAASKTVPIDVVRHAFELGVTDFGENYVRELREKVPAVPDARWHFIGGLQTSGVHHIASLADVVETVAGGPATARLARRAAEAGRPLDAMIEVDFTGVRSGVPPRSLLPLVDLVAALRGLRLVGLMTLPPIPERPADSRPYFAQLRELRDLAQGTHPSVLDLSMGMSLDYEVAIEEGATIVRVGTALFGERPSA